MYVCVMYSQYRVARSCWVADSPAAETKCSTNVDPSFLTYDLAAEYLCGSGRPGTYDRSI